MPTFPFMQVDVSTDTPLNGNPHAKKEISIGRLSAGVHRPSSRRIACLREIDDNCGVITSL